MSEEKHIAHLREWQNTMDQQLRAEDGWLTLAGLHWLSPGENLTGGNPTHPVPLPAGVPDTVGTLTLLNDTDVIFETAPEVTVTIDDKQVSGKIELESDINRNPTIIQLGSISFFIVIRGARTGVRVKDTQSPVRLNFPGRVWWPVDKKLRVTAQISYHQPPKLVGIPDLLGDINETAMDAALKFEVNGNTCTLDAVKLPSGQFYIIFKDKSCGKGSYPPGRFLVSEEAEGDTVVIDFNKAYNPPCAFTNFATCPLPPKDNHLEIPIQAGERYRQLDGHH
jgi:uncharacterized protein (DUF1684 family)